MRVHLRSSRSLILAALSLLLFVLACGSFSVFGTTSRLGEVCPQSANPISRTTVGFRETVRIAPFTLWAHVGYSAPAGVPSDQQLALVTLRWHNPTTAVTTTNTVTETTALTVTGPVSVTYRSTLRITEVQRYRGGRERGDWTVTQESVALYGRGLPDTIPEGDSQHTVPILIPAGSVEQMEVILPYYGPPDGNADPDVTLRFLRSRRPDPCP